MWPDKKNTQLKAFLLLYSVLLIYSKFTTSQIIHGRATPVAPRKNWIKAISIHLIRKTFPVFSIDSVVKKSQVKSCLPNWFINALTGSNTLAYNICHWVGIYRLLQNFWLLLANIFSKFSTIIDYYEIPSYLIDELYWAQCNLFLPQL